MSFFKYPEYWSKKQIDFSEKLLDVIRESPLSCSDVCGVMNDVSERIENISRRAGELFSAKETLPRAAEKRLTRRQGWYNGDKRTRLRRRSQDR